MRPAPRQSSAGSSLPLRSLPLWLALLPALLLPPGCGGEGERTDPGTRHPGPRVQVLEEAAGAGPEAAPGDWILVHYVGWLAQGGGQLRQDKRQLPSKGTQFDSSHERGEPLVLRLDARTVIPGWIEGMAGMRPGGRRTILVPPELAYGARSVGEIPALSWLIFEIELLDLPRVASEDLSPGDGPPAAAGDTLAVRYAGWLGEEGAKGRRFDPAGEGGPGREPFLFVLGADQVIPGWDLGLRGLRPGGSRRLTIPPELAYGSFGSIRSGEIVVPPRATLIYEVELVRLGRPAAPAAPLP